LWTIALDEVHLQDECLQLRTDHDPFKVGDMAYKLPGFGIWLIRVEVRTHTISQIHRFSHVDHFAIGVFHEVTTGLIGKTVKLCLERFRDIHHAGFDYTPLKNTIGLFTV
jgi:hypothetical protein